MRDRVEVERRAAPRLRRARRHGRWRGSNAGRRAEGRRPELTEPRHRHVLQACRRSCRRRAPAGAARAAAAISSGVTPSSLPAIASLVPPPRSSASFSSRISFGFRRVDRVQLALFHARHCRSAAIRCASRPSPNVEVEPRPLGAACLARSMRVRSVPETGASMCCSCASSGMSGGMRRVRTPSNDRSRSSTCAVGEIAVVRVHLGHAGAERYGERKVASDPLAAALDRDIDPVGPPGAAGAAIVKRHRRAADAEPPQQAERALAFPRGLPVARGAAARGQRRLLARRDLGGDHAGRHRASDAARAARSPPGSARAHRRAGRRAQTRWSFPESSPAARHRAGTR